MLIVGESALEYWQRIRWERFYYKELEIIPDAGGFPGNYFVARRFPLAKPHAYDAIAPTDKQLPNYLSLLSVELSKPLHIGVAIRNNRDQSHLKQPHLLTNVALNHAFIRISDRIFMGTPEFVYAQLVPPLSFIDALRLGYGLCGHYLMIPSDDGTTTYIQLVEALTSRELLQRFIDHNEGLRGVGKVRSLLRFLCNGSASPMETALVLLLCLPVARGGYGLPFPKLNAPIDPTAHECSGIQQRRFFCDLLWNDANLVVEYDGEESHTGINHIARDSSRRNDLQHLGFTVLTVTRKQLYKHDGLQYLATQIAKHLGIHLRYQRSGITWENRHAKLIHQLLYQSDRINRLAIDSQGI